MRKRWSTTFLVGMYTCEMTYAENKKGKSLNVHWWPAIPNELFEPELKQYRAGRDRFMAEIAEDLGGSVMVLET